MDAFVRHKFARGFLLDEERIRKINHILQERLKIFDDEAEPKYKVYHSDSLVYETTNIEDIVKEENSSWKKIIRITVLADYPGKVILTLDFDSDGTVLLIDGSGRDNVYLLFSDLREYLENEVTTVKVYPWLRRLVTGIVFLILMLPFLYFSFSIYRIPHIDRDVVDSVIADDDVHVKIDFLIESSYLSRSVFRNPMIQILMTIGSMVLVMIITLIGPDAIARPYRYLVPTNLFLLGKESGRYNQRVALRGKIVWGVGIALVVGVAAGFVVKYLG